MLKRVLPIGMSFGVASMIMTLSPISAFAKNSTSFQMKESQIQLNSQILSRPFSFTYQNTTYMPLFYVQQLLNKLQIKNQWNGHTWTINTPFSSQPTFILKTTSGPMAIQVNSKPFAAHVDKVVALDPASKSDTTFVPIWYMMQALKSIGLQSNWSGNTWTIEAAYTDVSKTNTLLGTFTSLMDAKTALLDYPGGMVQDSQRHTLFTEQSFTQVDLRYPAPSNINASSLNQYLSQHNSIMAGLGQAFIDAQKKYGVNANYLVSHAIEETGSNGNASAIALSKNNLYGYGAFDANAATDAGAFPSESYAIKFQAWEVRNNYLNPNSSNYVSPTLNGMSQNYASDPAWANKVNDLMDQLAIDMDDTVTSYKQYSSNHQPPVPSGSQDIPEYMMNGAVGTVMADPNYGSQIPVYSDGGVGHQHMFVRTLALGDVGEDVQTLQQALNTVNNANLQTDGRFGPETKSALQTYQSAHGLPPTGQCDFALWNNALNLSAAATTVQAGQSISVDAIEEGMVGGNVTQWYHIPNMGWIDSSDVTLKNVRRLTVPNPSSAKDVSIPVTDSTGKVIATLHEGDYVVSVHTGDGTATNKTMIQFADQNTGAAMTGFITTNAATLSTVE